MLTFKSDFLSPIHRMLIVACVGVQTNVHPCVSHRMSGMKAAFLLCACSWGAGGILLMLWRKRLRLMAFKRSDDGFQPLTVAP